VFYDQFVATKIVGKEEINTFPGSLSRKDFSKPVSGSLAQFVNINPKTKPNWQSGESYHRL